MKRYILQISLFLSLGLLLLGCDKKDTDFRAFFGDKEVVYPGVALKVFTASGKNRAAILFNPSPDQSVKKYVVYWNNKADSLVVNATTHNTLDTVKLLIPNLQEYVYSFTVYSVDDKGNHSVPLSVNNIKVYGSLYENGLLNRAYNATNPYLLNESNGSVKLNFTPTDTIDGFNISTLVKYTNAANVSVEKSMRPDSTVITLPNYKLGSAIQYRSSYVPKPGALDTFWVANYSTFPQVYSIVQCDKALFREVNLPNDIGIYQSDTRVSKLWDGSVGPQGYPNIFHSTDNGAYMPHVFTFDMGKVYNKLFQMEETGRNCCGNPDRFEVWGIADLTNASTALRADNSGWKNEMTAKGWTLLKDVIRTDDGSNAMKFDLLNNAPPIRYIRIRVIHTVNNGNTSNLSELTFWNKQ
ncbi:MAG: hypothetical protein JWN56_3043 [Sphingobacteriales bacterium]|nr:hypothetical protein [Sphingobacteriales bacterium]